MKRSTCLTLAIVGLLAVQFATAQTRHELKIPDIEGYQTLKCDLHTHTVFSDGLVWPTVRVDEAWREGLDVIAISDHIEYQPHKNDIPTNHNRSYEIALGKAKERDIVLIRGTEVTRDTPPGHHNAIFLSNIDPLDTPDFYDVFDAAAKQEAFVFWNHPGWHGEEKGAWDEYHKKLLAKGQLHGIEICNGDSYYAYAHQIALDKNLTLLGDSDIHQPALDTGERPTDQRPLTLVFAKERTVEGVREALFARRTVVWQGERVFGRTPELTALFEACVTVHPPHMVKEDKHWVKIENGSVFEIKLERSGERGPRKITVPPLGSVLVRFDGPDAELAAGLDYRVAGFLVGPDRPLDVKLTVSEAK